MKGLSISLKVFVQAIILYICFRKKRKNFSFITRMEMFPVNEFEAGKNFASNQIREVYKGQEIN